MMITNNLHNLRYMCFNYLIIHMYVSIKNVLVCFAKKNGHVNLYNRMDFPLINLQLINALI